jgi:hypothetical protein
VDVDAVAGCLGSCGGEDSPCGISRGVFAGKAARPPLLRMVERWEMGTTWLIPGHAIETFPEEMKAVAAGHGIGMHGYGALPGRGGARAPGRPMPASPPSSGRAARSTGSGSDSGA